MKTSVVFAAVFGYLSLLGTANAKEWIIVTPEHSFESVAQIVERLKENSGRRLEQMQVAKVSQDRFILVDGDDAFIQELQSRTAGHVGFFPNTPVEVFNEVWHRDRLDGAIDKNPFSASHTGHNTTVYVLDTGIRATHQDFGGRAVQGASTVGGLPRDGHGHGTHVASTAVGDKWGVAVDARVVGVKVLSDSGGGSTFQVIQGIEWAVSDSSGEPSVISMSLGGGKSQALDLAVIEAANAGHIVVLAAGNSYMDACDVSPAGASANGIVTVGASMKDDTIASFSNYGPCVEIFAPGVQVVAASHLDDTSSTKMSGTSMATPVVAGIAAVLLEKHNKDVTAALSEMWALTQMGRIEAPLPTTNTIAQVPVYTGPPTPPTVSPTLPPTFAPARLCERNGNKCVDPEASNFGGREPHGTDSIAAFLKRSSTLLCEPTDDNFTGMIVLVTRGECYFATKVLNAQRRGAIGVIFENKKNSQLIVPQPPASGGETLPDIPSAMVQFGSVNSMENSVVSWGSKSEFDKITPAPTNKGTVAPTLAPTVKQRKDCDKIGKRDKCINRKDCRWHKPTKSCDIKTDTPTSAPSVTSPPTCNNGKDCDRISKRRKCINRNDCRWYTSTNSCDIKTDAPTSAPSEDPQDPTSPPTSNNGKDCDRISKRRKCINRNDCRWYTSTNSCDIKTDAPTPAPSSSLPASSPNPSKHPTREPTLKPSHHPTREPTLKPSQHPSV